MELAVRGQKGRPRAHGPTGAGIGTGAGTGIGTGFGTGTGLQQGKNKRKDCSRVKCWNCHKIGHFATNCPEKRRKGKVKNVAATTVDDDFSSRFEQEFAMVAGTASPRQWYIDSGAFRHMTWSQDQFSELRLETQDVDIILGDDRAVSVAGIGIVSFQRESLPPLRLQQVFFVPGLRKNPVSVSCIEDVGFTLTFVDR